jgi:seryl-tRNA synthetase
MPTEELGASAFRKYDIEVWMPGRGDWGEVDLIKYIVSIRLISLQVSSLSNCTDYQSRRLHIRYRKCSTSPDTGIEYCHTLNGTAAAIPRLLIALLENGVNFEGSRIQNLELPDVLRPFWLGTDTISNVPILWV